METLNNILTMSKILGYIHIVFYFDKNKMFLVFGFFNVKLIVNCLFKQFKDILLLEEDIPHVRGASKVSLAELEKDMSQLRNNLKEVEREIEFQRVQPAVPGDMFLPVMKEFLTTATCKFSELEDLFQDMKTRVSVCTAIVFVILEYLKKKKRVVFTV